MPTLSIAIKIDDPKIQKEFVDTFIKQHQNNFIASLVPQGADAIEAATAFQAATDEDKMNFIQDIISQQVVSDFANLQIQQATQELQKTLIDDAKAKLEPNKTAKPFKLSRG